MKNANITKWAKLLQTTTEEQTIGRLCRVDQEGSKSYCCLGLGSAKLVDGMRIGWPDATNIQYGETSVAAWFGYKQVTDLAPIEFMEWLGLSRHRGSEAEEYDVYIDMPREHEDRDGNPLMWGTAAALNDAGLTFAQIGDLVLHFGVTGSSGF